MRLFSRWGELVEPAAEKLLAPTGWRPPDRKVPDRGGVGERYLQPLADALGERVPVRGRVVGVARPRPGPGGRRRP